MTGKGTRCHSCFMQITVDTQLPFTLSDLMHSSCILHYSMLIIENEKMYVFYVGDTLFLSLFTHLYVYLHVYKASTTCSVSNSTLPCLWTVVWFNTPLITEFRGNGYNRCRGLLAIFLFDKKKKAERNSKSLGPGMGTKMCFCLFLFLTLVCWTRIYE